MPVTATHKDAAARTLTITSEFDSSVERVWNVWSDPRQLERWWGPPTYPATVIEHDLSPGGRVRYYMTGPEGDRHHGWWRIRSVSAPHTLEFEDGFADANGEPSPDMPVTIVRVTLEPTAGGRTRMEVAATFASTEAMEQLLAMGMEEGIVLATGQIDAILTESPTPA